MHILFDSFDNEFSEGFHHEGLAHDNYEGGTDFFMHGHHFHSEDNIFGGHSFTEDGVHVGHSENNIFGGHDYFDNDNHLFLRTQENHDGSEFMYGDGGFLGTMEHLMDGHDVFHMASGDTTDVFSGNIGNGAHILEYDDPLEHIGEYIMPDLIL